MGLVVHVLGPIPHENRDLVLREARRDPHERAAQRPARGRHRPAAASNTEHQPHGAELFHGEPEFAKSLSLFRNNALAIEIVDAQNISSFELCKILYQFLNSRLVRRKAAA